MAKVTFGEIKVVPEDTIKEVKHTDKVDVAPDLPAPKIGGFIPSVRLPAIPKTVEVPKDNQKQLDDLSTDFYAKMAEVESKIMDIKGRTQTNHVRIHKLENKKVVVPPVKQITQGKDHSYELHEINEELDFLRAENIKQKTLNGILLIGGAVLLIMNFL